LWEIKMLHYLKAPTGYIFGELCAVPLSDVLGFGTVVTAFATEMVALWR
jgi:hypothetical protein